MSNPPKAKQTPKLGPRPLPLHLAIQTSTWLTSFGALTLLKNDSLPWRPSLEKPAAQLKKELDAVEPNEFAKALDDEIRNRLDTFAAGVLDYRRLPRAPRPPEPATVWQEGSNRLLDYGQTMDPAPKGAPLLVIPSLVNRAYILDIDEKRSFLRGLVQAGFHPYLLDWGTPDDRERTFDLTDIIAGRLDSALAALAEQTGQPVGVIGYCMGGLLALALAQRQPQHVSGLVLLATPWDFRATNASALRFLSVVRPQLEALIDAAGVLPVDVIQTLFASLSPYSAIEKFQHFAGAQPNASKTKQFVALEDWLNDGTPLAGPIAKECLFGWYLDNTPYEGTWLIDNEPVVPEQIDASAFVVIPEQDYIVPPDSARPLVNLLPNAEMLMASAGHIGMVTGRRRQSVLMTPLVRWLKKNLSS